MQEPSFVHLHVHSEYSIHDSLIKIPKLIEKTLEQNLPSVALTDLSNLFGLVKFYSKAIQAGIKPIIGAEVWISDQDAHHKLVLLCKNNQGYRNLTLLISKAFQEAKRDVIPIIPFEWLKESASGLIILSGGVKGSIGQAIVNGKLNDASKIIQEYQAVFGNDFYIELQRTKREHENNYVRQVIKLAEKHQCPVVATNDAIILDEADFEAHKARVCIQEGTLLNVNRDNRFSKEQWLKSPEEMIALFQDIPSALANTVEIAKRCNVTITLGKAFLPNFPVPESETVESYLHLAAKKGLAKRLTQIADGKNILPEDKPSFEQPYYDRLTFELEVINRMGYPGYFLIVWDFIRWAKEHDVPVGPGRGSGAGSLVAYALEITDLDPLQYDLLFERFLNPERVSMPDFDVDFCMEGRDRVIEYVAEHYGRESVSQIATFGTMAAKAVIRDVGRVLGHPYGFVDKISKLIPFEIGMTLDKALEQEEVLATRYKEEEEVRYLIDLAKKLEGLIRNVGKHAGGVVIAPSKLTDFSALYCEPESPQCVTQFDKDDVESVGLVKFDFLGLRTLTIINWAVKNANQLRIKKEEPPLNIANINLQDDKTFNLLKACETTAVFQLESRGMKELIHRLQPDQFEEIIALVALFRPGPLQSGMVDDFIDRKHGRAKVVYPHPDIAPILKPTYGVILYQEQVMQIAQVLAGYTLGEADILRRAMGKKKPEEMAKQREIFTNGAVERGVDETVAAGIFDLMEKFAGYGFNKSHSAAYALVSYQTAWLKSHYPAAFMAAVLSSDMNTTDKVVIFIDECNRMQLTVCPPCVNQSFYQFTLNAQEEIIYGMGAIKGVGEGAILNIIEEREQGGAYRDLFDFCKRVDIRKVNKRVLEALVRSGAMDCFGAERADLMASIEDATKSAEQFHKDSSTGQSDMFADFGSDIQEQTLRRVKPWSDKERLKGEKETLGHYLTGHPLKLIEEELGQFVSHGLHEIPTRDNTKIVIAGIISSIRTLVTKKGDKMAFLALEDCEGKFETAVFSDLYQKSREYLIKDELVIVEGIINRDAESGAIKMRAESVYNLPKAREKYAAKFKLTIDATKIKDIMLLKSAFEHTPKGNCQVEIHYKNANFLAKYVLPQEWQVQPTDEFIEAIQGSLGEENAVLEY